MVLVILPSEYQKALQFGVNRKAFVSFSDFREYTILKYGFSCSFSHSLFQPLQVKKLSVSD